MNWTGFLEKEIEYTYKVTEGLLELVDDKDLDWKPSDDNNWMTMGQLLMHIGDGCGCGIRSFVTGNWTLPNGVDMAEMKPEEMMPLADALPTVKSVAEAKERLSNDLAVALEQVLSCTEVQLKTTVVGAPWDPRELPLCQRMVQMIDHLKQHKAQLFYYLKLQGKPVHTGNLWGM